MPHDSATPAECLDRECPHPASDHTATPELAARTEVVVWCASCRRHEVGRLPRRRFAWWRGDAPRGRRRFAGSA